MSSSKSSHATSTSLSSFTRSNFVSEYDTLSVTDRDLESDFSGSETPYSSSNGGVRCRIQWLGDASHFLVPSTSEPNSKLVVVRANGRVPLDSEWLIDWCDDTPECTIRSSRHPTQCISGTHLSASGIRLNLCQVQPPPGSAESVTWNDVEEQWTCIMGLANSRLSVSMNEHGGMAALILGISPVTKKDIWRIQLLRDREPPMPSPMPNRRRCRLMTHIKSKKTYLQAYPDGSLEGANVLTTPNPTEWIIASSGDHYTIRLADKTGHLIAGSGLRTWLGMTPSRWAIKKRDDPPTSLYAMGNVIDQWSCTIHPENQPNKLLRLEGTTPILADIPAPQDIRNQHKWRIYFVGEEATVPGSSTSTESEGETSSASQTPSSSTPYRVHIPESSTLSNKPSFQPPAPTPADVAHQESSVPTTPNSEGGIPPVIGRPDSTTPLASEAPSASVSDVPPHVTNWVNTHTMSMDDPVEPEVCATTPRAHSVSGAETPKQMRSPQPKASSLPAEDASSHQFSQEPINQDPSDSAAPAREPRACHIQHVLTGMYLDVASNTVGLAAELDDDNMWFMQPAGPGYTLVMPASENSNQAQYLAPKRVKERSGKAKLGFSAYPAPWDFSIKQERYATTSAIGDVEWICKIRWPFTGDSIMAESARNRPAGFEEDGNGNALLWLGEERAGLDELGNLCELWRVQFLA